MDDPIYYQIEFHVPGFIEAYVLLPGERVRRKFHEYTRGDTLAETEQNVITAMNRQYPGAIRLYEKEMKAEKRERGA